MESKLEPMSPRLNLAAFPFETGDREAYEARSKRSAIIYCDNQHPTACSSLIRSVIFCAYGAGFGYQVRKVSFFPGGVSLRVKTTSKKCEGHFAEYCDVCRGPAPLAAIVGVAHAPLCGDQCGPPICSHWRDIWVQCLCEDIITRGTSSGWSCHPYSLMDLHSSEGLQPARPPITALHLGHRALGTPDLFSALCRGILRLWH